VPISFTLLCEGNSIRAVTRVTGASKNTVTKLVVDAGRACAAYQDRVLRNLTCQHVQLDEIWNFVYAKKRTWMLPKLHPMTLATYGPGPRCAPTPSFL
jgi:hypothetical protein